MRAHVWVSEWRWYMRISRSSASSRDSVSLACSRLSGAPSPSQNTCSACKLHFDSGLWEACQPASTMPAPKYLPRSQKAGDGVRAGHHYEKAVPGFFPSGDAAVTLSNNHGSMEACIGAAHPLSQQHHELAAQNDALQRPVAAG